MTRDPVKQNLNRIRPRFCNEVFALIDQRGPRSMAFVNTGIGNRSNEGRGIA
jgi:hypothetical protein